MMNVGDITLTRKQKEYIWAIGHVDKALCKYQNFLYEHAGIWQNDMERFKKFEKMAREITGLEEAYNKLEQTRKELSTAYYPKIGSKVVYYNKEMKKEMR